MVTRISAGGRVLHIRACVSELTSALHAVEHVDLRSCKLKILYEAGARIPRRIQGLWCTSQTYITYTYAYSWATTHVFSVSCMSIVERLQICSGKATRVF